MPLPEAHFVHALWITFAGSTLLAALLSILPRAGAAGRRVSEALCYAPLLDVVVGCLTIVPWILALALGGWAALLGALVGQFAALGVWCAGHELAFNRTARGPKIVEFHSRIVGDWRNYAALGITLVALPIFWSVRLMQITLGWTLPVLLNFPSYKQRDWINVSRHKFDGLIGHDLVWCLYCDWMTGVWSLGSEVLRNVESFWCPIRYYDGKKCANCAVDFPDIDNGWVPADGTMPDVLAKMEQMYGDGRREWFGHPARLTVKGKPLTPAEAGG
ncbi:MAG TPA: hypothetical protein VER17_19410 [Tepidisphaeraceae bacterium]|nr:hypothetical protein [Tepidisphaeraceae bacterium]